MILGNYANVIAMPNGGKISIDNLIEFSERIDPSNDSLEAGESREEVFRVIDAAVFRLRELLLDPQKLKAFLSRSDSLVFVNEAFKNRHIFDSNSEKVLELIQSTMVGNYSAKPDSRSQPELELEPVSVKDWNDFLSNSKLDTSSLELYMDLAQKLLNNPNQLNKISPVIQLFVAKVKESLGDEISISNESLEILAGFFASINV